MRRLLAAPVILVAATGLAAEPLPTDPLPADGTVPGWVRSGPVKSFTGAELYGYIDGGSEIFLELGFDRLLVQDYARGDAEMSVEVYLMTDPVAARGIYLAKSGVETPADDLQERHTVGRYQLTMQRERAFVVVNNLAGEASLVPTMVAFARAVAARLPTDPGVPLLDTLPREGLVPGSQRIIRGPFGLQSIITLGDGDVLSLGGRIAAVAADYRAAAGERTTRIVVDYPDSEAATAAFTHLTSRLDPYLQVIVAEPRRLVFKDYAGKFGEILTTGPRLTAHLHLPSVPGLTQ